MGATRWFFVVHSPRTAHAQPDSTAFKTDTHALSASRSELCGKVNEDVDAQGDVFG